MNAQLTFILTFTMLFMAVAICEGKWCMLRAPGPLKKQPYSWSRVQLAWWSIIILAAFITILFQKNEPPKLDASIVILLGISAVTTAAARVIDTPSNGAGPTIFLASEGFFLDILSDNTGVSISRFQNIVFNIAFGVWFIVYVFQHLGGNAVQVMPKIDYPNLALLGLSSATYAAIKTTENKETPATNLEASAMAGDGSVG